MCEEIMTIEDYEDEFLVESFDYLVKNDFLTKTCMKKNQISTRYDFHDSSKNNRIYNWLQVCS